METTLQPSSQNIRSKIATIEAIELASVGFALWFLFAILTFSDPDMTFFDQIHVFVLFEGLLLGSWAIYNTYIRIARAGGRVVDIGIWILASAVTASYSFWAWTILDLNRWLMSRLFYRGKAPVEYAWSIRSKRIRKAWEQMRKAGTVS